MSSDDEGRPGETPKRHFRPSVESRAPPTRVTVWASGLAPASPPIGRMVPVTGSAPARTTTVFGSGRLATLSKSVASCRSSCRDGRPIRRSRRRRCTPSGAPFSARSSAFLSSLRSLVNAARRLRPLSMTKTVPASPAGIASTYFRIAARPFCRERASRWSGLTTKTVLCARRGRRRAASAAGAARSGGGQQPERRRRRRLEVVDRRLLAVHEELEVAPSPRPATGLPFVSRTRTSTSAADGLHRASSRGARGPPAARAPRGRGEERRTAKAAWTLHWSAPDTSS